MKSIKILCSLLLVLMVCSAFSLKGSKDKSVYIVGVSASFTDSLVYFTEIQEMDSVWLDNKMLPRRSAWGRCVVFGFLNWRNVYERIAKD